MTNAEEILDFQQLVRMVPIAESVARYAVELVRATRPNDASAPDFVKKYVNFGASVRAAQFLVLAAKARALMHGRYHVTYEDIRALAPPDPAPPRAAEFPRRIRPAGLRRHLEASAGSEAGAAAIGRSRPTESAAAIDSSALSIRAFWPGISGLDLVAKTVVDGFVAGLHRSPDFGFSQEFAEYRAYTPGDDLRHVDWNVYARTERAYLKRYRGETNASSPCCWMPAPPWATARTAVTKLDYARFLAASLAYLANQQRDAAGRDRLRRRCAQLRPAVHPAGPVHARCCMPSRTPRLGKRTDFAKPFVHFQEFLKRRGIVRGDLRFLRSSPRRDHQAPSSRCVPRQRTDSVPRPRSAGDSSRSCENRSLLVDMETQDASKFARIRQARVPRSKIDAHIEALKRKAQRRRHRLFPAPHGPAARRRAARILPDPPGEDVDGFSCALVSGRIGGRRPAALDSSAAAVPQHAACRSAR